MTMEKDVLQEQIDKLTRERDAFSHALTTSNQAFMEKVKEFSIIKRLADSLQFGMGRRQICSVIVDIIIDETNAENCSLWLIDKTGRWISPYAVRGQYDSHTRYLTRGQGPTLEVGKGAAGWAAASGESLLIEDVSTSPYFLPFSGGTQIRSLLCLPIKGSDGTIGVLNMSHPDIGAFSRENQRVLQLITDQAAIGLTSNQLFEEVQDLNKDLERKVTKRTIHLKRSEERYQRAINAGKVGIWEWQVGSPDIYIAENLSDMLGYQPEETRTLKDWMRLIYPEDRRTFLRRIVRHMRGEASIYEGEHRMLHRDGQVVWFFVRAAAVRSAEGRLSRIVGSNTDITRRKETELELARAQEEALIHAHAAGKAEFATTVLHNIGNVLNSVNVDSLHIKKTLEHMRLPQLALTCGILNENRDHMTEFLTQDDRGRKIPEYLGKLSGMLSRDAKSLIRLADEIASKVDLMRDIIETQQTFATTATDLQPQDLAHLVEEAIKVQSDSIRKREVTLKQRFSAVPPVLVNGPKLIHVLINLIKNAVEAMESVPPSERKLSLRIGRRSGKAFLAVTDNGIGIHADHLGCMFQHGFTTKKSGHGFGLHYCARTLEAMGGQITVDQ